MCILPAVCWGVKNYVERKGGMSFLSLLTEAFGDARFLSSVVNKTVTSVPLTSLPY